MKWRSHWKRNNCHVWYRDKFRVDTFLVIIDQLQSALQNRNDTYIQVRSVFQVVSDFNDLDTIFRTSYCLNAGAIPKLLHYIFQTMTIFEAQHSVWQKSTVQICNEMVQFVAFARSRGCTSSSDVAMLIHNEKLYDMFPNVSMAVRMFTCIQLFGRTFILRSFSQSNGINKEQITQHYNRRAIVGARASECGKWLVR